jgi:hypothetical protein
MGGFGQLTEPIILPSQKVEYSQIVRERHLLETRKYLYFKMNEDGEITDTRRLNNKTA